MRTPGIFLLLLTQLATGQTRAATGDGAAHAGSAIRLMQDRLYSEAAAEFEKALAIDPNDDPVRIQYATCLFIQERNDEARKQFEMERRRLGDRSGLIYYLGILDLRTGNYTAAIRKLQTLESDPAFSRASFYLGLAYQSAGQTSQALESLERAAKINPGDPEVHYRLGRVYSLAGRADDADREYKIYREGHENQRIAEEQGHACMDALRAQPIAAAREVCKLIADPNDSLRLTFLGQLYAGAGAFADAVEPLQTAARLNPKSFEAWHYLGLSLYGLHRYQEAVGPLENAAALNPQFFDTLNLLAKTLHVLGNDAAALPVLERAHNLNPGDAGVTRALDQMRAGLKAKP